MQNVPNKLHRERVLLAIEDPNNEPLAPELEVVAGDSRYLVDLSERREEFKVEHREDGALVVDSVISGGLLRKLHNAPIRVTVFIGGIPVRMFTGRAYRPRVSRSSTQLLAASTGALLERWKIDEKISFKGAPETLVRRVAQKAYGQARVHVVPLGGSIKRDTEDTGFEPEQSVRDVLSAISEETGAVYADTPHDTFRAFPDPNLGQTPTHVWEYEALEETDWTVEPAADDLYSGVVVEKKPDPPTQDANGNEVAGKPGYKIRVPVHHPELLWQPGSGLLDWHVITADDPAATAPKRFAAELARKHAKEVSSFSMTVPLHPLLERYDTIRVGQDVREEGGTGTWRYEYVCVLNGTLTHDFKSMLTGLAGSAVLVRQAFTPDPPIVIRSRSPQVVVPEVAAGLAYGEEFGRLWIDPDNAINNAGIKWAGEENGRLWVDPDFAPFTGVELGRLYLDT